VKREREKKKRMDQILSDMIKYTRTSSEINVIFDIAILDNNISI